MWLPRTCFPGSVPCPHNGPIWDPIFSPLKLTCFQKIRHLTPTLCFWARIFELAPFFWRLLSAQASNYADSDKCSKNVPPVYSAFLRLFSHWYHPPEKHGVYFDRLKFSSHFQFFLMPVFPSFCPQRICRCQRKRCVLCATAGIFRRCILCKRDKKSTLI